MGIQIWGAFGGFQNKTGALVGHWVNGQNVITAIPHPSQKPPTDAQLNQRNKFKLIVSWLKWINGLIRAGYLSHKATQSPFNAAVAYNYKNAITGVAPDFMIDYSKIVYSNGMLGTAYLPSIAATAAGKVDIDWEAYVPNGIGAATDKATFLVYNPAKDRFVFLAGVVSRSALTYSMALPADFSDDIIHCWMSFVSEDGKMSSHSTYIGEMPVL